MSETNKIKFGKTFYFASLVVAITIFIVGKVLLLKDETLDEIIKMKYSFIIHLLVFAVITPVGVVIREYMLLAYKRNIMLIKIAFIAVMTIVSVITLLGSEAQTLYTLLTFLAYGVLIVALIPSSSFQKKTDQQ